ncbi:hypothetical protein D915_010094 [Fasciola hepatica]|uniref:Uncharacterized protein n=1 Tax=Fasciola hepatica TaxID=6192 RepID=A0A4E0RAW4_FASHE|nr:hypothetical protein D915_010094 [Fasciola hepatica]
MFCENNHIELVQRLSISSMKTFGQTLHDSFLNTIECQILTLLPKQIH